MPDEPGPGPDAELAAMRACADALTELDDAARSRTLSWLNDRFDFAPSEPREQADPQGRRGQVTGHNSNSTDQTVKDFVIEKAPKSEAERAAVLAYYRAHAQDSATFKTVDLSKLNTEAAQPRVSNMSYVVREATDRYRLFTQADGKTKQLTPLGEELVRALPDRDAVKAAIEEQGRPRRRARKKANGK